MKSLDRFTALAAALLTSLPASSAMAGPVVSRASANVYLGPAPLLGVNIAGCEFMANGALCPTPATVNLYIDKGFRVLRIPFRGAQAADPVVVAKIKAAADAATSRGAYVILDRHDYGSTFSPELAAWWGKFIKKFPDSDRVLIDTMNEPKTGLPYEPDPVTHKSYATEVNAGIAKFRAAGYRHKLLIEWRGWSGMSRFDKNEGTSKPCDSPACSFDKAGGLKDPIGQTIISGHRYPDVGGSGTSAACLPDVTAERLLRNTDLAAKARGLKVWIGEFAFGNHAAVSPTCEKIGRAVIERMRAMPGTYAGISFWGGGSGWKEDYIYKIEPKKGTFATAKASKYLLMLTR